jgi:hypothetical protein
MRSPSALARRARVGAAFDQARLVGEGVGGAARPRQLLGGVNLVAARLDAGEARQRPFGDGEGDDEVFAFERDALAHFHRGPAVAEVAHPRLNRAAVAVERLLARVAAAVGDERDEAEQVRRAAPQLVLALFDEELVGALDAQVGELEAAAALHVVGDGDLTVG